MIYPVKQSHPNFHVVIEGIWLDGRFHSGLELDADEAWITGRLSGQLRPRLPYYFGR